MRVLSPALEQAAAIASALEGRVPNVPKVGEATDVKAALTAADTAAQEALIVPLLARFRGARLEAEEDTRSAELFTGATPGQRIVIDPIDGTLHFYLGRRGPYAVMAGLALDGRYEAALVALPREGLRFEAVRGGGARRLVARRAAERAPLSTGGHRVLLSHGVPEAVAAHLRRGGLETAPACGGAVAVAPLLPDVLGGVRLARAATRTISTRGRIGLLVAREAGAVVETAAGEPFPDSLDAPASSLVVAADTAAAARLREALADVDHICV